MVSTVAVSRDIRVALLVVGLTTADLTSLQHGDLVTLGDVRLAGLKAVGRVVRQRYPGVEFEICLCFGRTNAELETQLRALAGDGAVLIPLDDGTDENEDT